MEEKILDILINMQNEQFIMKKNIAKILEVQTEMKKQMQEMKKDIVDLKKGQKEIKKEATVKYKELDYRIAVLEP